MKDPEHNSKIILSTEAENIISNLQYFPNLETFTLDIDWDITKWREELYHFFPYGNNTWTANEETEPWRILLNTFFICLSRTQLPPNNESRHFMINNLPPIPYSALSSITLNPYLSRITDFTINLMPGEMSNYWTMTKFHETLTQNLHTYFLSHLISASTMSIHAAENANIINNWTTSPTSSPSYSFPLICLPNLQNLTLEYCYMNQSKQAFLTSLTPTIKSITLINCYCHDYDHTWIELFDSMLDMSSSTLINFEILPVELEWIERDEEYFNDWPRRSEYDKIQAGLLERGGEGTRRRRGWE